MKCKHCGEEIANDSNYCEFCGKAVSKDNRKIWHILGVVLLGSLIFFFISYILLPQYLYDGSDIEEVQVVEEPQVEDYLVQEGIDLGLPSGTVWKEENEVDDYYTYEQAANRFGDNLPTKDQFEELLNNCEWNWTGSGYMIVGPNGNSMFLPASGYYHPDSCRVYGMDVAGYYWSSSQSGLALAFDSPDTKVKMEFYGLSYGFSVRLVW